ncbi:TPR-like protein [Hortaea werneckii]|uniref:TPR-like protein n=1 Tax=Hortaea werneckii TaxID=91943 RepID=A0A3M7E2I9_HORWE|nr:TPR-like protein [Hortaea werneckii]KAI6875211.1 TPR-like protein [Hortaea werneckii]KAI7356652.1 TPR-like protein [Hortaea werneckii]RMY70758.1 hypothetical protein D0863_05595 [Hortaea werneckii]RMY85794.1 hypothetical protein D0862_11077 [Hortaea werneckii]
MDAAQTYFDGAATDYDYDPHEYDEDESAASEDWSSEGEGGEEEEDEDDATPSLGQHGDQMYPDNFLMNLDPRLAQESVAQSSANAANVPDQQPSTESVLSEAMNYAAQASAYWSNAKNLGFGEDQPEQQPIDNLIAGAPMQNEFYQPMDDEALDDIMSDPALLGLNEMDMAAPSDVSPPPRSRGRGRPRGSRSERGDRGQRARGRSRGWKWAIAGTEWDRRKQKAEERARENAARGVRRGRKRGGRGPGRPVGGSNPADPGIEYKEHQTKATQAWMDGDLELALDEARKAVQANPEVFTAHMLLSEILAKIGREQDAVAALMSGANTRQDAGVWNQVAERTLRLAGDNPSEQYRSQALFAYSHALRLSSRRHGDHMDEVNQYIARCGKRDMSLELNDFNEARMQCAGMLRLRPIDMDNVRLFAELCAESGGTGEYWRAREAYERAFKLLDQEGNDLGEPEDAWSHVNIYMEILDRINTPTTGPSFFDQPKNYRHALVKLRQLARWILGRKDEPFWDTFEDDDREWDCTHERRAYVAEFQQGRTSRDRAQFGDGLPIELRVKLGLLRIKLGMPSHEEGLRHLDHLMQQSDHADAYYDLFVHVCDTLRGNLLWDHALKFYGAVQEVLEVNDESFFLGMAQCYAETEKYGDAEDTYRALISSHPQKVQARIELAKLYEKQGWKEEALPLIKEVIKMGHKSKIVKNGLLPHNREPPKPKKTEPKKPKAPKKPKSKPARRSSHASPPPATQYPQPLQQAPEPYDMVPIVAHADLQEHPQRDESSHPSRQESPYASEAPQVGKSRKSAARPRKTYYVNNRLQKIQLQADSVADNWEIVQMHWPALELGYDQGAITQWTDAAVALLQAFCEMDAFFPARRDKRTRKQEFNGYVRNHRSWDDQASESQKEANTLFERLRSQREDADDVEYTGTVHQAKPLPPSTPREFHGITFPEWHHLFVDLALQYANVGAQDRCLFVLKSVIFRANVFSYDPVLNNTSLSAALCCALKFNNSALITDIGRKYITHGDYRASMPYHLLAATSRLIFGPTEFNAGSNMKFMARMIKNLDHAVLPEEVRSKVDWGNATPALKKRLEKYGEDSGELDAGVLMVYGHMLVITQNIGLTSAISYYLRALALQPDSFSTNLCLGLCFIHNSMRRQTDNRHYNIQQGLAFVYRYYQLRTADGLVGHIQEAEYNVARIWHLLGLTHLAVFGYEKVLALSGDVKAAGKFEVDHEPEDFAKEAAFALQQIFALAGNEEAAQDITERWLVL